jgi:hypothetical protein
MGTHISVQPLMMNPKILSAPTDLDGLGRLMASIIPESETEAIGKKFRR